MKKTILTPTVSIKTLKYREEDIYYYELKGSCSLIKSMSGFTDAEGVKLLESGKLPKKEMMYELMNKEDLNIFRTNLYVSACELLTKNRKTEKLDYFSALNKEEYSLYKLDYSSHRVLDIKGELQPILINLNNPLYYINGKNFNLEEVLKIVSEDSRFITFDKKENNIYSKWLLENNGFVIREIPSYNRRDCDDCDDSEDYVEYNECYIDLCYSPTDEEWFKFIEVCKNNKVINKNNIIYLTNLFVELGFLPFKLPEEKRIYSKNMK